MLKIRVLTAVKILLQLAIILALFQVCNLLTSHFDWIIPGSVIGLGILVVLLLTHIVPEQAVSAGAGWLLSELLLFFIPPVVSILKHWMEIRDDIFTILTTVILGTLMVLSGTAWIVDRVFRLEKRLHERHGNSGAQHHV